MVAAMRLLGRRRRARERERERVRAFWAAREQAERDREARAAAWRAAAPVTPDRVRLEYEARRAALAPELAERARPAAAWTLRRGEPRVDSSHVGGAPAMYPGEPWPADPGTMRFWAQVNLAELAPYAAAYRVRMPADGLLQLFAGDQGGELARHLPAAEMAALELRREIPLGSEWGDEEDGRRREATTLLIDLHPEAVVGIPDAIELQGDATVSEDLRGYCFGPFPWSRPGDAAALTCLATCNSQSELGLAYSDEGMLWASLPTADLAAGDFRRLRCQGESS
jgi:hypothetical protein